MVEERSFNIYPQRWAQIAFLCGFCLVLYFVNLGQWDLWNPDEPRYAQVAREMVHGGDWVLMHSNGEVYADKPPLFFWLIGLSSFLWQGFSSFSVRLPSALFGTLTVLLTFFLGKNLFSSRVGFVSGLILATSLDFAYLSTRANIDATLTFFTTASFLCFLQWYRTRGEGGLPHRRRPILSIYGFYAGMALATLTKGPIGFLLPLLVVFVYLLVQKDWKGLKEMKLLPGLLLLIAIILAWYLPAVLKGGRDYLNMTLLKQSVERYSTGWSHVRPFYYYLYNFPVDFLPWLLFLPAALVYGYSKETLGRRKEFLFLVVWFVVIFLFFSASKGKRGLYLLPLFPAASLMVGTLWEDFLSSRMEHFRREWISVPLYGLMGLTLIGGTALPWVVSARFPSYLFYSLSIALLMVGASVAMFFLYRSRRYGVIFFLIVGIMAGGFFYTLRVVFPLVNPHKSARFISQEISSRIRPGEKMALYGGFGLGPYNFYTGIVPILELKNRNALFAFLGSQERVYCLLDSRELSRLKTEQGMPPFQLITQRKVGNNEMVLISNR